MDLGLPINTVDVSLLCYWDCNLCCTFANSAFAAIIEGAVFSVVQALSDIGSLEKVMRGEIQVFQMEDLIQDSQGNNVLAIVSPVMKSGSVAGFYFSVSIMLRRDKK